MYQTTSSCVSVRAGSGSVIQIDPSLARDPWSLIIKLIGKVSLGPDV